jgi:hypothetical protein
MCVDDFIVRAVADGHFRCSVCAQTSSERGVLVRHVESKHFSPGYACPVCTKPFRAKYLLQRHEKKYH